MTVFNCQQYVKLSVESALSQVAAAFEVVIINDGSTDLTGEILDGFKDERLIVMHYTRMGRTRALNLGLEKCAAPYVAILDADDIALPHRLHAQIAYLDANQDIALVGSRYRPFIDKDGHPIKEDIFPIEFPEITRELREFKCPIFHSSIMFRKERVREVGGYNESLACNSDWDLYVRLGLAARFPIANIDERLSLKRLHADQFFGGSNGIQFSPSGRQAAETVMRRISSLRQGP